MRPQQETAAKGTHPGARRGRFGVAKYLLKKMKVTKAP